MSKETYFSCSTLLSTLLSNLPYLSCLSGGGTIAIAPHEPRSSPHTTNLKSPTISASPSSSCLGHNLGSLCGTPALARQLPHSRSIRQGTWQSQAASRSNQLQRFAATPYDVPPTLVSSSPRFCILYWLGDLRKGVMSSQGKMVDGACTCCVLCRWRKERGGWDGSHKGLFALFLSLLLILIDLTPTTSCMALGWWIWHHSLFWGIELWMRRVILIPLAT